MANNKKPRKKYRRVVIVSDKLMPPIVFGMSSDMKTDLQLTPHMLLEAFKTGCGSEQGAHTLAAAVNLGAVLARAESAEVQAEFAAALDAMHRVMARGKDGKWGMSGDDMTAIGQALTLSGDMQEQRTRREMRDAIASVYREAAL